MKKINKKLSLCIALALMQSVYVSNSFAADATGVTNQGSRYYFGVGTEPTLEDLSKKGIIDYKKASQKSQNNNENGEGAGPNALDKNNYGALAAGMGAFASHGYSTAVGYNATSVISSTSLGAASYATSNSAAVGVNAYATNKGTSVGNNTQSTNGVAIGYNATAGDFYKNLPGELFSSYSGTAIGNNAFARGGVAVGDSASAEAYGVALGDRTYVAWRGSALGDSASVLANGGVALGPDAVADTAAGKIGFVATAAGQPATEMELAASIGKADVVNQFNNKWSEKNNEYTEVMKNYYSLYDEAQKNDDILRNTKGSTDAEKQKAYETALAKKADLSTRMLGATKQKNAWLSQNKDFLNALEEKNNALSAWRSSDGAISVGSAAYTDENGKFHAANTRQITNLAAGTEDTDAVNVAQLKSVKNLVDELNTDQTTNNENITKLQGGFTVSNEIGTKTDIRLGGENKTDIKFIGAKDKIDVSVETTAEGAKITIAPNAKLGETLDISNNTSITNLNNRVDNLEVKFGDINDQIAANKVTVEGDSNSGVKVENVAQEGDPVKYKVSLEDKVQVGNVTIEGSTDNGNKIGEITGLTNTTLNSADFATTGRAATEEQLKSVMDTLGTVGSVDLSAGENIQIDKLGNNDYKVSLKDDISLNSIEAKEYKVGNETYIDSNGINANNKTISNVAPGRVDATSTDAVNGSQLYQVKQDIQGLSNDISRFGEEIDSVGALSAAMAGLHPRFQDGNKGELAMAMGSYDGKNALAVGGFYAPNQEVMFSLGMGITQGGKKMGNIGVNFALDRTKKGEVPKRDIIYTRREVDTSLKAQEEKIQLLLMKLEAQSREIETLKAKLQ
ncbi:YadA-like family protein [Phascolarctobacterium faecium]|uniref:YadA-like family protein n=1 Tax=Phascolarctobacterium faecium TaxID=33025 RepID=UPI002FE2D28D